MTENSSKRYTSHAQPRADASPQPNEISVEERRAMIAEAAYYRSQQRIAASGLADELTDWLEAEQAIDQQITSAAPAHQHGKRADA